MWNMVRRLARLSPRDTAKIVVGQIIPILPYGAELPWGTREETAWGNVRLGGRGP